RITVNLAPADLPKDSGRFDLAIAVAILVASGQLRSPDLAVALRDLIFVGELSLTGQLLPIRGAFAMAAGFVRHQQSGQCLVLPLENQAEASLIGSDHLRFAASLRQVALHLKSREPLMTPQVLPVRPLESESQEDWSEIRGQGFAKRAALIAAAGHHNLLMLGPPGIGKSMIASRIAGLLPPLTHQQACTLAAIQSLSGGIDLAGWQKAPYRAPHHSISSRAMIGGGQPVRPGEVSLAHHGLLFLDELPEFPRDALESLREPLERAEVSIARVRDRVSFPADVMLIAAMNPCPCGYFGVRRARRPCRCSPDRVLRYRSRISGPLMDRFDMVIQLEAPMAADLSESAGLDSDPDQTTESLARWVGQAREKQLARQSCANARLGPTPLLQHASLEPAAEQLMLRAAGRWGWSARAWHRVLRVARTIADLDATSRIEPAHVAEAIELRRAIDIEPDWSASESAR
ncbi:MAG: YifB family Mg chelatase-like AAA ATPase, partial [Burkholderiaceae bacterium]|nr:YifB family Mg chelatase-like AAA ATPase [Burkholderiaceae bacterium]